MMTRARGKQPGGAKERSAVLEALARKCGPYATEHGIAYDRTPAEFWMLLEPEVYGAFGFSIPDGIRALLALETPFEHHRMLLGSGYRAMWSPVFGTIECEVAPCEAYGNWDHVSSRGKDRTARMILDELDVCCVV